MEEVRLRSYRDEDRPFLVDLRYESENEFFRMDPGHNRALTRETAEAHVTEGLGLQWAKRTLFYIAEVDGERAGLVIAGAANEPWDRPQGTRPDGWRYAEIHELHVAARFRRNGVATELVRAAEVELARQGFDEVVLRHFGANAPAAALYESLGYGLLHEERSRRLR